MIVANKKQHTVRIDSRLPLAQFAASGLVLVLANVQNGPPIKPPPSRFKTILHPTDSGMKNLVFQNNSWANDDFGLRVVFVAAVTDSCSQHVAKQNQTFQSTACTLI